MICSKTGCILTNNPVRCRHVDLRLHRNIPVRSICKFNTIDHIQLLITQGLTPPQIFFGIVTCIGVAWVYFLVSHGRKHTPTIRSKANKFRRFPRPRAARSRRWTRFSARAKLVSPPKMLLARTGLSATSVSLLFSMEIRLVGLETTRLALGRRVMSLPRSDDRVRDGPRDCLTLWKAGLDRTRMDIKHQPQALDRSIRDTNNVQNANVCISMGQNSLVSSIGDFVL